MKKHYHAQCCRVDGQQQQAMQEQLRLDIHRLERELQALQTSPDAADFELVNSYRTMLHHRHSLLTDLREVSHRHI